MDKWPRRGDPSMRLFHSGILFPASILASQWFQILSGFVTFNSLIYLGLTMARLIPMPHQGAPKILSVAAKNLLTEQKLIKLNQAPSTLFVIDPYLALRMRIMQETIPTALALLASAIIGINLFALFTLRNLGLFSYIVTFSVATLVLMFSLYCSHKKISPVFLAWFWMAASTMAIAKVLFDSAGATPDMDMALAGIFLVLTPSMTLVRLPTFIGIVLQSCMFLVTDFLVESSEVIPWFLVGLAGLVMGLIVRSIRMKSLAELAFERDRQDALAPTDLVSGVLTRVGIVSLEPSIFALARVTAGKIYVSVCGLENLLTISESYGRDYCDVLVREVAAAISRVVRPSGLTARWDESTFIVVGVGEAPKIATFKESISRELNATGVELGKIPLEIKVGAAVTDLEGASIERILESAAESTL